MDRKFLLVNGYVFFKWVRKIVLLRRGFLDTTGKRRGNCVDCRKQDVWDNAFHIWKFHYDNDRSFTLLNREGFS